MKKKRDLDRSGEIRISRYAMSHDRARMTSADAKIIARYSSSICCEFAIEAAEARRAVI